MGRAYKYVRRINLRNIRIGKQTVGELPVLINAGSGKPFLLPLLYTTFLLKNGFVLRYRRSRYSEPVYKKSYLCETTIKSYISALHMFLECLQEYSATSSNGEIRANADQLHLIDQHYVTVYLNEYLPPRFGSVRSLRLHQAAIQALFDWLTYFEFADSLTVTLRNGVHDVIGVSKKDKSSVVQYVSREHRQRLLRRCRTERDRLVLRAGFELGLRAAENLALVLDEQTIRARRKPGLLKLFAKLDKDPHVQGFEYWLDGQFCKGGRSRPILIPRRLLTAMHRYYLGERKEKLGKLRKASNHLFVNYSRLEKAEISVQYATDLFRSLRDQIPHLDQISYHDLRHTFGTELYASLLAPDGCGRSEQRALTIVQDRLGHADPRSTLVYVHLFEHMQIAERRDVAT